ncbi:histidine phosphatase family protein [Microbacterium sp. H1-D42]|uniref:histidine phosphatase family protein n=1 Tax=Microbacterium sp. H1-D42 TaxID=2925844 RepID=UPI001F52D737|nr:histidine phosphatase family protein [Microbacterium sp. H1-D42]UNK71584.1 histidine phosphatase family protein [Microbacterium sp. H1-D42]
MPEMTRRTALLSLGATALTGTLAVAAATPAAAAVPAHRNHGGNRKVTVYLVRHGQTWMNLAGRVQGWGDSPLTQKGIDVATAVGRNLAAEIGGFDAAYSGDMVRHFQTATEMLAGAGSRLSPTRVRGLREVAYGGWEGASQQKEGGPLMKYLADNGLDFTVQNLIQAFGATNPIPELPTETYDQVAKRMKDALTAMATDRTMSMKHGGNILAVSSGMSSVVLLESLGVEGLGELHNGAVNKLVYANGKWTVEYVNEDKYAH